MFDAPPDRARLFDWLGTTDTGQAGDVWDLALETAKGEQAADCSLDPYTPGLHAACLRRAARFAASKGLTLGAFDGGDFGQIYLPRWDTEIERYEAPHRLGGFA